MKAKSPVLLTFAILTYAFLYGPIVLLIALSFNRSPISARWTGFTTLWYRQLAHDDDILRSARYSVIVAGATTLIATTLGTLAAVALSRKSVPGRAATVGVLYLPIVIPEVVLGCALLTFFATTHWQLSIWTVLAAHVSFSISYVAVIVRARLEGFDRSLEEAALDLGAKPLGMFARVKLPLMLPGIIAGALLVFTVSVDDYVVTSFVAGTDSTTLPLRIASMVKTGLTPEVNAVSTLLLGVTIVLVAISQWLLQGNQIRTLEA